MPNAIQLANGPLPQAANTTLTATIPSSGAATPTVASAANLPTKGRSCWWSTTNGSRSTRSAGRP